MSIEEKGSDEITMDDLEIDTNLILIPNLSEYEYCEKIGSGAQGQVWKVYNKNLERYEALKVLSNPKSQKRFLVEMTKQASLHHSNIVAVYSTDTDKRYFTMEYMEGGTLRDLLQDSLSFEKKIAVFKQIAAGLQHAHEKRVVHRDLKPSNIMFDSEGNAKIADFGLVKKIDEKSLTGSKGLLGTPQYMAPEQWDTAAEVDHRCDIWALGVILYQLSTMQAPFKAETPPQLMYSVYNSRPTSFREVGKGFSPEVFLLEPVCEKALAKNRDSRYQSVGEMVQDIENAVKGEVSIVSTSTPEVEKISKIQKENLRKLEKNGEIDTFVLERKRGWEQYWENFLKRISVSGFLPIDKRQLRNVLRIKSELYTPLLDSIESAEEAGMFAEATELLYELSNKVGKKIVFLEDWKKRCQENASRLAEIKIKIQRRNCPPRDCRVLYKVLEEGLELSPVDKQIRDAYQEIKDKIAIWDEQIATLTQEGLSFSEQKKYAKAIQVWQKALSLAPENPHIIAKHIEFANRQICEKTRGLFRRKPWNNLFLFYFFTTIGLLLGVFTTLFSFHVLLQIAKVFFDLEKELLFLGIYVRPVFLGVGFVSFLLGVITFVKLEVTKTTIKCWLLRGIVVFLAIFIAKMASLNYILLVIVPALWGELLIENIVLFLLATKIKKNSPK